MRAVIAGVGILLSAAPSLSAQASRTWRVEDRVVIGNWTRVRAVAAGPERVFIVSPDAVLVWWPTMRRWEGPYEPPVAGSLGRVAAGMVDPLDNSLWLATSDGWVHFQPELQIWDRGQAGGRLLDFAFDRAAPESGLFMRTPSGWVRVPRGALLSMPSAAPVRPLRPATVEQAVAANPALRGSASAVLLDPALRNARLTSAARSYDNLGWYLGTDGVGTLFLPDGSAMPDRLAFGLPGSVAGAVTAVPGGVFVMTDREADRFSGLAFVAGDLGEFRTTVGPAATGFPFTRARRLIGVGSSLWAATDAGVLRISASDPSGFTMYGERDGLPDRRVWGLASWRGVVVAATARGLARFADTTGAEPLSPQFGAVAYAVALAGDTAWVGTANGPRIALPSSPDLIRPAWLDSSAALVRPVYDLAWMADTLVGITSDQFIWKVPGADHWTLAAPISGVLGALRRLVPDRDGFWVAGEAAVGWTPLGGSPVRPLVVGPDLPGEPLDLAVDAHYLWVATSAGLVRFRLSEVRP